MEAVIPEPTPEPVEAAPVEAAPVEAAPVEAAPVEAADSDKQSWDGANSEQAAETVDKSLYSAFTVGDIKVTNSVPHNKPPTQEDTIEGRYATVLFVAASEQESMYAIYEDFQYISDLYANSESFRLFT